MVWGQLLAVLLFSFVSQLHAVDECDRHITEGTLKLTQVPSWVSQFSGLEAWLVSASPDDEFGITESYSLSFNQSCGNTVVVYITQTFNDGKVTVHSHALIKESHSVYYYEPGFDLYLTFFACSADLVGAYKCKPNSDDETLFLIMSPSAKKPADIAHQLETCKKNIRSIVPRADFKDMYYPGTIPAGTFKTGNGLVKRIKNIFG